VFSVEVAGEDCGAGVAVAAAGEAGLCACSVCAGVFVRAARLRAGAGALSQRGSLWAWALPFPLLARAPARFCRFLCGRFMPIMPLYGVFVFLYGVFVVTLKWVHE